MNLFKRNMYGELNWICFLFGHKWIFVGEYPHHCICERCELFGENEKEFKK